MSGPQSDASWQYRQLNLTAPGLDYLSDALLALVEQGVPVVAATADLQYSNGLRKFREDQKNSPLFFFNFSVKC